MLLLAIALIVLAACCLAFAAARQHDAVASQVPHDQVRRHLGPRQVLKLIRDPQWLQGVGLATAGALLHISALRLAPVVVIQPIGVLAVPISVLLTARRHQVRPSRRVWWAVGASVLGVAGFVALTAGQSRSQVPTLRAILVVVAVVAVLVTVGALLASRLQGRAATLLWAGAGAATFGMGSALIKALFLEWDAGHRIDDPVVWGTAIVIVLAWLSGSWMIQHGYLAGTPEVVVGAMTVTDPVVAVLIGIVLLGEGGFAPPVLAAMSAAAVLAVVGVVELSRHQARELLPGRSEGGIGTTTGRVERERT